MRIGPTITWAPELAVQAHVQVRGRTMIPVHWALLKLAQHTWTEPVERCALGGSLPRCGGSRAASRRERGADAAPCDSAVVAGLAVGFGQRSPGALHPQWRSRRARHARCMLPAMIDRLTIDPRYNGPNTSGNGGWVAGSLARLLGTGPVSVSLRAPAPLAAPMLVRRRTGAKSERARSERPLRPAVLAAASHAAMGCEYCRGRWGEDGIVATTWTPPSFVADVSGELSVEATWTALDCSAGFAWMRRLAAGTAIITARMTAVIDQPLQMGHRYTVIGWPIAQDGRKLHAGTAISTLAAKCRHGRGNSG